MAGSIPFDKARKQLLSEKSKKQEEDCRATGGMRTAKLSIKGQTVLAPIYRFNLDDLAFNKSNGRIKAEVIEKEAELGRELDQFNLEDSKIIRDILLSIRRDENDKIREDLRKNTQITTGIVTCDGIVINGNRRKALLGELYEETYDEKFKYLDAHTLPSDISKAELWLIEAGIQLSAPQQLDYSPINNLLKLREGVNAGLKIEDMASRIYGVSEDKIQDDLARLYLIDEYLSDFLNKPGKYYLVSLLDNHFINLFNILNYFKNPRGIRKDWTPTEDDINELKLVAFYYIRMRLPHLRIRDLRDIFLSHSSWEKVRQALTVEPELTDEEKEHFKIGATPTEKSLDKVEESPGEEDLLNDEEEENNNNVPISATEEEDKREDLAWRENRKGILQGIFEDAKEQKKISDNAEKPLILAQRALNNIQGIPNDKEKLADPEIDKVLGEIILTTNTLRKIIKNSSKHGIQIKMRESNARRK
jgi:hypothetical protein